jgi:hypothetical protein
MQSAELTHSTTHILGFTLRDYAFPEQLVDEGVRAGLSAGADSREGVLHRKGKMVTFMKQDYVLCERVAHIVVRSRMNVFSETIQPSVTQM